MGNDCLHLRLPVNLNPLRVCACSTSRSSFTSGSSGSSGSWFDNNGAWFTSTISISSAIFSSSQHWHPHTKALTTSFNVVFQIVEPILNSCPKQKTKKTQEFDISPCHSRPCHFIVTKLHSCSLHFFYSRVMTSRSIHKNHPQYHIKFIILPAISTSILSLSSIFLCKPSKKQHYLLCWKCWRFPPSSISSTSATAGLNACGGGSSTVSSFASSMTTFCRLFLGEFQWNIYMDLSWTFRRTKTNVCN